MSLRSLVLTALLVLPAPARAQSPLMVAPGRGFDPSRLHLRTDTAWITVVRDGEVRQGPLQIESIVRGSWAGRPALVHRIRVESPRMTMDDTTWYDPTTFAPLAHRSHGPRTIALDYAGLRVTGMITDSTGASRPVDVTLAAPAFDPSALHAVLGSMVFRPGLTAELAMFSHEQLAVAPTRVAVLGKETLTTAAGSVEAWHLSVERAERRVEYWVRASDGVDLKVAVALGDGAAMRIAKGGVR